MEGTQRARYGVWRMAPKLPCPLPATTSLCLLTQKLSQSYCSRVFKPFRPRQHIKKAETSLCRQNSHSQSYGFFQFSWVQFRPFATPWTAAHQVSLSIINSRSLLKLTSIGSVMPSNHLILCLLLLLLCLLLLLPPSTFPASESFQMSQFFTSGGQSIGVSASASVLLMNIQDWFPLGLTGWISLQSKGFSRVFSNTTVQKHQFFSVQFSSWSKTHSHTWLLEKP